MTNPENQAQVRAAVGSSRFWSILILLGIILSGIALSLWRIQQVDRRMRDALLDEALLIGEALRGDALAEFRCNQSDLGTPNYERIKAQLVEARKLFPYIRFIYAMREQPDGRISFLVDSEPPESTDYSPPGQSYDEASVVLREVFGSGKAMTEGPMKDRWGVWFSAFVPLYHPYNNSQVGVLGVDIDASEWRSDLLRGVIPPVVATLVLIILAVIFLYVRRVPVGAPGHRVNQRWEMVVSLVFGVVLTVAFALAVNENEIWKNHQAFRRLATVQANALQALLYRMEGTYLEAIARFFKSSDSVDRHEFADYMDYLLKRPYAKSWSWVPVVEEQNREAFEVANRHPEHASFFVWEHGPGGTPVPAEPRRLYYPVCFIEPLAQHQTWLGYDLGSEPDYTKAMTEADQSGMLSISTPRPLPAAGPGMYSEVFLPVYQRDGSGRLSGFATASIEMDQLLARMMGRDKELGAEDALVELYFMESNRSPLFLASSDSDRKGKLMDDLVTQKGLRGLMSFAAPAFAFGRAFAVVAKPGPGFTNLYSRHEGLRAGAVGLVVTGLVTALMTLLTNRRAKLEREVVARTAELRKSEESYRGLFNAIQQSIYIQDEKAKFIDVNVGAAERYGYAREEFIGRTSKFLSAPGKNDLGRMREYFDGAWAGKPQHFEFWGLCKNGEVFPEDVWLCKGTYMGKDVVIAVSTDISERKKSEEETRRLQSQLLQSQKMESIGRLAGGVAHDFNNMLQAIIGNTNLAKQEIAPDAPVADYLNEIEQSAHRSARLTRQLLAFASKQTIQPRILDLNDTVAGMLKMLQRLIGEDIELLWRPGPNLWPVKIDPGQIDQILANLAVNARDAVSVNGMIEIETSNHACDPDHCSRSCTRCRPCKNVVISVRDNGCGMNDEVRQHLFEPFYTTKEPGKGTGLGLATVFGIVQQNEGAIDVESAPGQGTTIRILLPMIETAQPLPVPASVESALNGRETILLVEDEAMILQVGMISLQRLGYAVLVASTPDIALRVAQEFPDPIHLLITDVIMPGMNGPDLARRIVDLKPDIACLFMSGYTADVISTRSVLDESVNFIQKPFTISELAAKIRLVLDNRG
jgi:PAS domain S-box-containing protein